MIESDNWNIKRWAMSAIINLHKVSKAFGNNLILRNVNLSIPEGKIFGIMGGNGSGKTTLLRLLVGYYKPNSGSVLYKGQDIRGIMPMVRKTFGFAAQESSFYPELTINENMKYFGRLYGLSDKLIGENMKQILRFVSLDHVRNRLSENLSTGMMRRLDIACSLIHNPDVLILDEPTEDLDPLLRKEMLDLLLRIKAQGKTIILTSHLLSEVESVCDRIALLHEKDIIAEGDAYELKKRYCENEEIALRLRSGDYVNFLKLFGKQGVSIRGNKVVIETCDANDTLHHLLHYVERTGDDIISISASMPPLENVFEKIMKKRKND